LHVPEIPVGQRETVYAVVLEPHTIVGLLVLPPTDVPDEAVVVQLDPLPAELQAAVVATVGDPEAIQLRRLRIRDDRLSLPQPVNTRGLVGVAICGLGVLELAEELEAPNLGSLEAETQTDGRGAAAPETIVGFDSRNTALTGSASFACCCA
jgi:hypothetical protein